MSEHIEIKKDTLWKAAAFIFAGLFLLTLFLNGNGGSGGTVIQPTQPSAVNPPAQAAQVTASVDDDAFLGDANAPVKLIEFSDYNCPFCGRFYSQTLPQLKSVYLDTGKVQFVYRDFPLLSLHPNAGVVAEAAECVRDAAGNDEAYFKMHDKIFDNPGNTGRANLELWAKEFGYDIAGCLNSGKFTEEWKKDLADAQAAGGRGTPFFVIVGKDGKGIPLSGAQPFSAFDAALKAAGA